MFDRKGSSKDGRKSWCKACGKVISHRRYEAKRKEILAAGRKWKAENPEKVKTRSNEYCAEHREERNAYKRTKYNENPQADWARRGEWVRNNPVKAREQRRRRAHLVKNAGEIDVVAWNNKLKDLEYKCQHCGTTNRVEMDHKIPLFKGGTNHIDNLQPLCHPCNSRKGIRIE